MFFGLVIDIYPKRYLHSGDLCRTFTSRNCKTIDKEYE